MAEWQVAGKPAREKSQSGRQLGPAIEQRWWRLVWLSVAQVHLPAPPCVRAERRWGRVVRSAQRLRRLQRIWGLLGSWLQQWPSDLRDRLRDVFPAGRRGRHGRCRGVGSARCSVEFTGLESS